MKHIWDVCVELNQRYLKSILGFISGGWSFGTQKFKDMSATRYSRQTFIYSAIPFLRDRHFDGLDLDWEYPKGGDDKKNFVLLLKGKKKILTTFVVKNSDNNINKSAYGAVCQLRE